MPRLALALSLATLAAASTLAACVAGVAPQTGEQNPEPSGSGTSTSATDPPPAKSAGSSGSSGSGSSTGSLGPQCTAYMACCAEVAKAQPQLAASCESVQTQIESAQANGTSTSAYEPGCKSGISTFKSAGYCN